MKKLMTMLAVAAMAFGLYADAITPIDSFDASDSGATLTDDQWKYDGTTITEGALPPAAEVSIADSLLKIQTGSKKLTREFLAESASTNIPADGLFFDINLSFLDPMDGTDPVTNSLGDAKIAAAVIDNSAALEEITGTQLDPSTNLYVIGAYKNGDTWTKRAYMFANSDLSGTTANRLTIKMYNNALASGKCPAFRFFAKGVKTALTVKYTFPILDNGTIDFANPEEVDEYMGVAATDIAAAVRSRYADKSLILSLAAGAGSDAVKAVDFVGKANIADFKLTEDPMFIDPDAYTMSVAYDSEDVTITGVSGTVGNPTFVNGVITYDANETLLTVEAEYATGLTIVKWAINDAPVTADAPFTPVRNGTLTITATAPAASVTVNGVTTDYETFAEALAAVQTTGGTLKLAQDYAVDPTKGSAITFSAANAIVLDLAGNDIQGSDPDTGSIVVKDGAMLTITNSVGTGHVKIPYCNDGEEAWGDTSVSVKSVSTLVIAEGVMDGKVATAEGATATQIVGGTFDGEIADANEPDVTEITGGNFKKSVFGEVEPNIPFIADGYEAVEGPTGYWQLQKIVYVNAYFVVDGETNETVTVKSGEAPATTLTPTKTGYTFKGWNPALGTTITKDTEFVAQFEEILVTKVELDITVTNVAPKDVFTLTATVTPADALDPSITWTSSDGTVATVTDAGVVTIADNAANDATATITATNVKSGEKATCTVTVKAAEPDYPEDWPEADDKVKEAFKLWKAENPGADLTDPVTQNLFLLNLPADADVPELEITSIVVEGTTATIKVAADEVDLGKINGVIFVETSENLSAWTPTAVTGTVTEKVWTGSVTAPFIKAKVGFKVPAAD